MSNQHKPCGIRVTARAPHTIQEWELQVDGQGGHRITSYRRYECQNPAATGNSWRVTARYHAQVWRLPHLIPLAEVPAPPAELIAAELAKLV